MGGARLRYNLEIGSHRATCGSRNRVVLHGRYLVKQHRGEDSDSWGSSKVSLLTIGRGGDAKLDLLGLIERGGVFGALERHAITTDDDADGAVPDTGFPAGDDEQHEVHDTGGLALAGCAGTKNLAGKRGENKDVRDYDSQGDKGVATRRAARSFVVIADGAEGPSAKQARKGDTSCQGKPEEQVHGDTWAGVHASVAGSKD